MSVLDMYHDFRSKYPDVTKIADFEHIKVWDEVDPDFSYSWFESLANALNSLMKKQVPLENIEPIYEYFQNRFEVGDNAEKDCIDVSFVENLLWRAEPKIAKPYWLAFPTV